MKLMFIISYKYYKEYLSYINLYLDNIYKYYGNGSNDNNYEEVNVIIIDNNSIDKQNIKSKQSYIFIENTSDSKFEIGAYTFALKYIIDNSLLYYDYYIFTQDNFIINKKYDFLSHFNNKNYASSIMHLKKNYDNNDINDIYAYNFLKKNKMDENFIETINIHCIAMSFILYKDFIIQLFDIISKIIPKNRQEACIFERYLGKILYEFNNKSYHSIDGDFTLKKYDWDTIDLLNCDIDHYFIKKRQDKYNWKDLKDL